MRVSSIRYQPVEGGTLGGHFALHVTLGGDEAPEAFSFEPSEVASRIHDAFEELDLKTSVDRGVLIDAREDPNVSSEEMIELIGILRDWKLLITAWVSEKKRAAWFDGLNYLTVFVRSQHWPNFRASEIRYEPQKGDWIEPEIFEVNSKSLCYVHVSNGNLKPLYGFISNAKRPWGVISPLVLVSPVDFPLDE